MWLGRQAVDVGATEISFVVSVRVDGTESWDNNFGQNFTCRIEPDGVNWRCTGQALMSCSVAGCK